MGRVRIAFWGAAHVHTGTYMQEISRVAEAENIGVYDSDPIRLHDISAKYSIKAFEKPEDLIAAAPDVVFVCTENAKHIEAFRVLAEAGIDVISEKPLAVSFADLAEMLRTAAEKDIRLMTTFPNRYISAYRHLQDAYSDGSLGKILGIKATNKGAMPGSWFVDPALSGGGCIIDHTVHVADLVNNMLGTIPVSVEAFRTSGLYDGLPVEDAALVHIIYPDDMHVVLDASWSRMPSFPYGRDLTMHVVGSRESASIDYFAESDMVYSMNANKAELSFYGEDKDLMMLEDLVDCYLSGREFPITGRAGARSAVVALAALISAEEGHPVKLQDVVPEDLMELMK